MKINNDHQRENAMIFYQMEMSGDRYGKLLCTRRFPKFFMLANVIWSRKSFRIILKLQQKKDRSHIEYPEKTAVISRPHHWFPREVTS